jgi:hypothetical protein
MCRSFGRGARDCETWISLCMSRDAVCVVGKVGWQGVGRGLENADVSANWDFTASL